MKCCAVAGGCHHFCKEECPGKISEPDDGEESPVIGSLVDEVADFARKKVESEIQDGEKSESEKERSQNLIIAREKRCAAEANAKAGIDGFDKINHGAKFRYFRLNVNGLFQMRKFLAKKVPFPAKFRLYYCYEKFKNDFTSQAGHRCSSCFRMFFVFEKRQL